MAVGETPEAGSFGEFRGWVSYKGPFCHQLTSSSALSRTLRCMILLQIHGANSLQKLAGDLTSCYFQSGQKHQQNGLMNGENRAKR